MGIRLQFAVLTCRGSALVSVLLACASISLVSLFSYAETERLMLETLNQTAMIQANETAAGAMDYAFAKLSQNPNLQSLTYPGQLPPNEQVSIQLTKTSIYQTEILVSCQLTGRFPATRRIDANYYSVSKQLLSWKEE